MFDPATTVQILSDQLACMLNIPNSNDVYKSNIHTDREDSTNICNINLFGTSTLNSLE